MAGACECGNEPSGSMICGQFLDQLKSCYLLRQTLRHGIGGLFGWLVRIRVNVRHQRVFISLTTKMHLHYTQRLISNLKENTVYCH